MKKIRYSRIFILGVFIYILFKVVLILIGANVSTMAIEPENYEIKSKEKCLVIRNEYLVKSDIDGTLALLVDENDKVKKSSEVAIILNDEVDKDINETIKVLNDEIKELKKENNPLKEGIILSKKEEMKIYEQQIKKNSSSFYASSSGIISFKFDGYEEMYNIDSLDKITKKDINNAKNNYITSINKNNSIECGSVIYRMIDNNEVYLAFVNKDNELCNEGDSVKIRMDNQETNAEIYNTYKKDDYFITIIKITQQNSGIYDTRVEEFDIIYKQMESLRIPKSSIVMENNKKGVYVVDEETKKPYFQQIDGICFENDDYIYVDFRNNESQGIDSVDVHDRIILKPNFINKNVKVIN